MNTHGDHKLKILDIVGSRVSEPNRLEARIVKGREAHGGLKAAK